MYNISELNTRVNNWLNQYSGQTDNWFNNDIISEVKFDSRGVFEYTPEQAGTYNIIDSNRDLAITPAELDAFKERIRLTPKNK
jgi:hypothetical protein